MLYAMKKFLISLLILSAFYLLLNFVRAEECDLDCVSLQLTEEQQKLVDLEARKNALARQISSSSATLAQISAELSSAEADLAAVSAELTAREALLAQWEGQRNLLIRQAYKIKSTTFPLEVALGSEDFITAAKNLQSFEKGLDNLLAKITSLVGEINVFRENKAKAEQLRNDLASLRTQYQTALSSAQRNFSSTSSQLATTQSSLKNLTARQEQLILEKFAATSQSETVGDKEPVSTSLPTPGFSPAFAFATYGYPHRVGMNQYGAYGRAKDGQSYSTILAAYYQNTTLEGSCDKTRRINVQGYGEILLEDEYLTGIGEMPASWGSSGGMEALKAQAVAARSYALDYVARAGSICTTQSCQVFLGSGAKNGTLWQQAVNDTCGQVLTYGGAPIAAWYASTAGGYTLSSQEVWGSSRAWAQRLKDFGPSGAYDGPNYGNSPWYHKAWGSRTGSGYDPWMTEVEVADIFNSARLSAYSSSYNQYLSPPYNTSSPGWSIDQVKEELRRLGIIPLEKVTAVVTTFANDGFTTASVYGCDGGTCLNFSGKDFRAMFNLRSIGSLVIWTTLFDLIRP